MLIRLILIMLFWIPTTSVRGQYTGQPNISKYELTVDPSTDHVTLGEFGKEPKVSYESLKKQNIQGYTDFLDQLKLQAPDLFNQAVVIHSSGSLQPSQPKMPRVILYGENLSISFSTNPNIDPRVEILQFNKDNLDFTMHEIVFDSAGAQYNDNPAECKVCHGQPAKPVWEAYDFWPSAIGSQSGMTHSEEEKDLLEWVKNTTHTDPVLTRINRQNLKESIDTFTAYLTEQNFLAASQKNISSLQRGGELYPFRYALIGIMSCTDKSYQATIEPNLIYRDFLPDSVLLQWKIPFESLYDDVVVSNQRVKEDLWSYYTRIFYQAEKPQYPGLERLRVNEIVQASQLGFVFANLGLNIRDFTLSIRQDSYIMSTPNLFDFDLQKNFLYFWPELIDELKPTVKKINPEFEFFAFDCELLKQKSLAELENWQAIHKFSLLTANRPHGGLAPYGQCVTCHSREPKPGEAKPPYIPFENTWQLGRQLRNTDLFLTVRDRLTREDIKQMPKDLPHLSQEDIRSFMSTLEKIEKQSR